MKRAIAFIKQLSVLQIALICAAALLVLPTASIYFWLRSTLPDYTKTLESDRLSAAVTISRDAYGVPHIEAQNFTDAAFALGYAQAQDRYWQMETMRRAVRGRNAAVFGEDLFELDIRYQAHGSLSEVAEKSSARIEPEIREIFQAFADGVNLAIESGEATSSPEWALLGVQPEPWTMGDSNNFMTIISETATDGERELIVEAARMANSEQLNHLLFTPLPGNFPTLYEDFKTDTGSTDAPSNLPGGASDPEKHNGTNFFVLAPSRTKTGSPILAVDPHIPTHTPSLFYPVTITLPDNVIAGAAWIGSPSISFGQNSHIAWGITHLYADTFDYIVERIDPDNPNNYLTPEGSVPFEVAQIRTPVQGEEDRFISLRRTRNGVVVSDPLPTEDGEIPEGLSEEFKIVEEAFGPGHVVARRQLAVEEGQTTMQSLVKVSLAQSWDEFREALRDYEWTNNFVYADREGNIGVQMAARLPNRRQLNGWNGQRLARGWLGEGEWMGYVPFDDLPMIYNPPQGWIADSNSRTVDARTPFRVTDNFSSPWRITRAYEMVDAVERHDMASATKIQMDVQSHQARWILDRLLKIEMTSERSKAAMDMLRKWDLNMEMDRPEPLLYSTIALALQQRLINIHNNVAQSVSPDALQITHILDDAPHWCDHPDTDRVENCDDAVNDAVMLALDALSSQFGRNMSSWQWGKAHQTEFPPEYSWAHVPFLGDLARTTLPSPGGDGTLNVAAGTRPNATPQDLLSDLEFVHVHGAMYRMISDLGDPSQSTMSFAPGISGNAFSKHWSDMAQPWVDGEYFNLFPNQDGKRKITTITAIPGQ